MFTLLLKGKPVGLMAFVEDLMVYIIFFGLELSLFDKKDYVKKFLEWNYNLTVYFSNETY